MKCFPEEILREIPGTREEILTIPGETHGEIWKALDKLLEEFHEEFLNKCMKNNPVKDPCSNP